MTEVKEFQTMNMLHNFFDFVFQLALDDSLLRNDMMEIKDVWSIRASNMPRAGDSSVPNPGRV